MNRYQCICHNFQGDHEDECIEYNSRPEPSNTFLGLLEDIKDFIANLPQVWTTKDGRVIRSIWMINRAEELSLERYNMEYHELPEKIQDEVWQRAKAGWTDHYASTIDAAYDRAVEARLFGGSNEQSQKD